MKDPPAAPTMREVLNTLWQKSGMDTHMFNVLLSELSIVVMKAILEGKQVVIVGGARIVQTSNGNVVLVDTTGENITIEELKIRNPSATLSAIPQDPPPSG